jgi:hypothetical protein
VAPALPTPTGLKSLYASFSSEKEVLSSASAYQLDIKFLTYFRQ